MININDFFEIDENNVPAQKPINRLAYTDADIEYKAKCIKAMQELGMEVTIDKIGNICGTFPGQSINNRNINRSIICGSHTDSVDNGGQFDGPLGVYAAIKTAERIKESGKNHMVNYKAIIYACEESTRFSGKACIGSKYLRGDNIDFDKIISRDGCALSEIIPEYKTKLFATLSNTGCEPIKEVEKVVKQEEIMTAIEGHIEQADVLREHGNNIGICTSITAPYRLKADIWDINTAATFICNLHENARKSENLQKYRVTVPEFSILQRQKIDLRGKKILTVAVKGENNHSGTTPVDKRRDAVYGAAKFIKKLESNPLIIPVETYTPEWGANQITDHCEVKFAIDPNNFFGIMKAFQEAKNKVSESAKVSFECFEGEIKHDKAKETPGLYIDVRQQEGMKPEISNEMIYETIRDICHVTHGNSFLRVVSKGEPYETTSALVEEASNICEENGINYEILKSWAGHDLATLTRKPGARTVLLFCDNSGGSHNPNETTTIDAIEKLVTVESKLASKELERADEICLQAINGVISDRRKQPQFVGIEI